MELPEKHRLFERAYPDLFDFVYRYVCYRIPSRPDAEDVVSEVFVAAVATLNGFDPDRGNMSQWITGIARNKIHMHWRLRRTTVVFDDLDDSLVSSVAANAPGAVDEQLLIERVMKEVPAEGKALLAMRYVDDMTYDAIADVVGKSPGAVRQWFSRLHRTLRLRFNETES